MDHRIEQLKQLGLAERVRQLGNPTGPVGVAIGDYMNAMNGALNAVLFRKLSPQRGNRILEIGFGNGKLLSDLMNLAPDLSYDGIDVSDLMVAEATAFNRALVAAGRAAFQRASSTAIPFDAGTFDRAVAANTIYFWPDPARDLAEIRRVLKPDGVLGLAAMTAAGAAHLTAGGEPFRTYDDTQLRSLLVEAGFARVDIEPYREDARQPGGRTIQRVFHLVRAMVDAGGRLTPA
jgi:ubiquinone/menaquinone biosynthesis C-methylase UbiE